MPNVTLHSPDCNYLGQDRAEIGDDAELPPGFHPERYPIIAEHFFGWRPVGVVAAQIVQDLFPPAPLHEVEQ